MNNEFCTDVRRATKWIPFKGVRHAMRNTLQYMGNTLHHIATKEYTNRVNKILLDSTLHANKPKIFLLQTPEYANMGDQAITLGTLTFLRDYFPAHAIIEYSLDDIAFCSDLISRFIDEDDIIFLQGGGNMGNLWVEIEYARREVLRTFPNNRIIIFPVSITFTDDELGREELSQSIQCYSKHKNLSIMTRDKKSYEIAREHFVNNNIVLTPDIACYLTKYDFCFKGNREGVMLTFRSDKEKVLSNDLIKKIQCFLQKKHLNFKEVDTCINTHPITQTNRHHFVQEILSSFASHQLCITDRFHGMIFSYITSTPCIVFGSLDHKIPSGYEWLNDVKWIYKVDDDSNFDEISKKIIQLLSYSNLEDTDSTLHSTKNQATLADKFYEIFHTFYTSKEQ